MSNQTEQTLTIARRPDRLGRILLVFLLCAAPLCTGCRNYGGTLAVRSYEGGGALSPSLTTAVYREGAVESADIYLSDLPLDVLTGPTDRLAGATGNLLHINLFLMPHAGKTPIDPTACNITIRHVVLAGGAVGVYGGGGFVLPRGKPGDRTFGGTVQDATLRLIRADEGFADRLGATQLSGKFRAELDPALTEILAERFDRLVSPLPQVTER